ncbi:DUF4869 domain-containing protein [Peptacetobacter hiranonis]|uniref:DUF4869 domain-containing protein n=1 Tax=Peptacetobacter hiranonis (strain DSM 13275 / JCM 10541 / KCTC 15199 / TO-931) TaxID=500633 RepID=B6FXM2_PEPHT|nr:DUF4869 domain-containing protein [Peptacetobacter hiranonis]EEA85723.1 hypothetical protein CLOHIR_00621 [Peptacetobacter hiranonis DSM 13275]QEK20661.1 hypothetical protein KGNDJEFE_01144 [Peptacetobacter hiranonis]
MLKIYFGDNLEDENFIYNPKIYFNYNYDKEWFNDSFIKNMVEDIDKSKVIYEGIIDSPFLGIITPQELSGGVRALMLMYKTDKIINASACGDNCSKWILEIGKMKDLTIRLGYIMNFGDEEFEIYIANEDKIVRNTIDYVTLAGKYL